MTIMIGYGGSELANAFRTVRKNTVLIAEDIHEEKYECVASPGVRSGSARLRHIAYAPRVQTDLHRERRLTPLKGYDLTAITAKAAAEEKQPSYKPEIIALLRTE